jgi:hypothetical protein
MTHIKRWYSLNNWLIIIISILSTEFKCSSWIVELGLDLEVHVHNPGDNSNVRILTIMDPL